MSIEYKHGFRKQKDPVGEVELRRQTVFYDEESNAVFGIRTTRRQIPITKQFGALRKYTGGVRLPEIISLSLSSKTGRIVGENEENNRELVVKLTAPATDQDTGQRIEAVFIQAENVHRNRVKTRQDPLSGVIFDRLLRRKPHPFTIPLN